MNRLNRHISRNAAFAACALIYMGASMSAAQTPTTAKPAAEQPQQPEAEALRIRGLIDSVDENGVVVQLSQGITLRVDLDSGVPVYSAARIKRGDVKAGENIGVRTRTALGTGESTAAGEVLVSPSATDFRPGDMNLVGAFRSIDTSGERPLLALGEEGAERRVALTDETTFWRLTSASLKEVKVGVSISILLTRLADAPAKAERAVFGSTTPGSMLPL